MIRPLAMGEATAHAQRRPDQMTDDVAVVGRAVSEESRTRGSRRRYPSSGYW
jgi:hypothetical protein